MSNRQTFARVATRNKRRLTFVEVHVGRAVLGDVSRPGHADPLAGLQLGQDDRGDVGRGDQTPPQVQATVDPELVHHTDHLEVNNVRERNVLKYEVNVNLRSEMSRIVK